MQFNLCVLLFKKRDQKCFEELNKLRGLAESIKNDEYIVLANFYKQLIEDEDQAITFIEDKIETVHSPKMNLDAKSEIYLTLSDYYSRKKNALKAIMYVNYWKDLKK